MKNTARLSLAVGVSATCLLSPLHAHAEGSGFSIENPCPATEVIVWWESHHPGGTNGGKLNQHNTGLGLRCYVDQRQHFFIEADELRNSQRGSTKLFALGIQGALVWGPVSFEARLRRVFIDYYVPKYSAHARGWVSAPDIGIRYIFEGKKSGSFGISIVPVPKQKDVYLAYFGFRQEWE